MHTLLSAPSKVTAAHLSRPALLYRQSKPAAAS